MSDQKKQTQRLSTCDGACRGLHHSPSTYNAYRDTLRREQRQDLFRLLFWLLVLSVMTALFLWGLR